MKAARHTSKLRSESVMDALEDALFLLHDGTIIEANHAFVTLTGLAEGSLPVSAASLFQANTLDTPDALRTLNAWCESALRDGRFETAVTLAQGVNKKLVLKPVESEGERLLLGTLREPAAPTVQERVKQRLQTIVDHIDGIALFIKDRQGRYELVNDYFTRYICDDPLIGKTSDTVHPLKAAVLMNQIDKAVIETAETITYDETVTYKNGSLHDHRTTKIPLANDDGEVESVLGISVDLSERVAIEKQLMELNRELEGRVHERTAKMQQAYEALKASEARYRMIIETTSEGVWIIDSERRTIEINSSLSRMLGYTQEEMLGRTPMEFVDDENRKIFQAQTDTIEQSDYRSYEISLQRKDGSLLPAVFHANTIRDASGTVLMACAFVTDISEIKKVKADLQKKHDQMQAIFKSTREGLAIIDMETNFLEVNPAYTAITGYSKDELLDQSCLALSPDTDKPCALTMMQQLTEQGYVDTFEKACFTKSGDPLYLHMSAAMLDDGKHAVLAIKDITQMKHSQDALAKLNATLQERIDAALKEQETQQLQLRKQQRLAAMGEMLAMIAHQWRQPLTSISVTAATMLFKNSMDEYDKAFFNTQLNNISSYAQHLSRTIDDFRNFFKEDKTKSTVTAESIIESALSIIEVSLVSHGIAVERAFHCHRPLSLHANELRQVLLSLIKNAEDVLIEKRQTSPLITIETRCAGESVELHVCDNGGGIDAEVIDRVFDPYFTTKDEINGTGLGLYMSKTIIEEHCDGTIQVVNDAEGARFTITLPGKPQP